MKRFLLALLLIASCSLQAQIVEVWKDGKVIYASPFVFAGMSSTKIIRVDSLLNAPEDGVFLFEQPYTLSGYNLTEVSSVTIGDVSVPFSSTFDELTFTIPLGLNSGELVVHDRSYDDRYTQHVTFVSLPKMRIATVSPQSNVESGTIVHIQGDNLYLVPSMAYVDPVLQDTVLMDFDLDGDDKIAFYWPNVSGLEYVMVNLGQFWQNLYFNGAQPAPHVLYEADPAVQEYGQIVITNFDWASLNPDGDMSLTITFDLNEQADYSSFGVYSYQFSSQLDWVSVFPGNTSYTINLSSQQIRDIIRDGGIALYNIQEDLTIRSVVLQESYSIPEILQRLVLFEGAHDLGNWGEGLNFYNPDFYTDFTVGSQIVIEFTTDLSLYGYASVSFYANGWGSYAEFWSDDTSYTIDVDQDLYDAIMSVYGPGWGMLGCGLIINRVRIVQP